MYDLNRDRNQKFFADETAYYKNLYDKYSNETLSIQELLQGVILNGGKKIKDFDIYNADGSVNLSTLESLIPEIMRLQISTILIIYKNSLRHILSMQEMPKPPQKN